MVVKKSPTTTAHKTRRGGQSPAMKKRAMRGGMFEQREYNDRYKYHGRAQGPLSSPHVTASPPTYEVDPDANMFRPGLAAPVSPAVSNGQKRWQKAIKNTIQTKKVANAVKNNSQRKPTESNTNKLREMKNNSSKLVSDEQKRWQKAIKNTIQTKKVANAVKTVPVHASTPTSPAKESQRPILECKNATNMGKESCNMVQDIINKMALRDTKRPNIQDNVNDFVLGMMFFNTSSDSNEVIKTLFNHMLTKQDVYEQLENKFRMTKENIYKEWFEGEPTLNDFYYTNLSNDYQIELSKKRYPVDRIGPILRHHIVTKFNLENIGDVIQRRQPKSGGRGGYNPLNRNAGHLLKNLTTMSNVIATQEDYDKFKKKFLAGNSSAPTQPSSPAPTQPSPVAPVVAPVAAPVAAPMAAPMAAPAPPMASPVSTQQKKTKFNKNEIAAYTKILKTISGLDITILKSPIEMSSQAEESGAYHADVKMIYNTVKDLINNGTFNDAEDILVNYHGIKKDKSIPFILEGVTDFNKESYEPFKLEISRLNKLLKSLNKVVKNAEKWMNKLDLCPKK